MNHDIIFQSIAQWPENKPVQGVSIKGGQKDGESWVMWVCKDDKHGCRSSSLSWQSSLPQRQREAQLPDVEMYGTEKHGVWGAMAALDLRQTRCSRRGWLYLNGCPSVPAFPALARHFPRLSWLLQSPGPGMGELGVCSCKSDSKCWSYAYTICLWSLHRLYIDCKSSNNGHLHASLSRIIMRPASVCRLPEVWPANLSNRGLWTIYLPFCSRLVQMLRTKPGDTNKRKRSSEYRMQTESRIKYQITIYDDID